MYRSGITRSPSDFLCGDGELAECVNLVTDEEELKTVPSPAEFMDASGVLLLYVHVASNFTHYIAAERHVSGFYKVFWGTRNASGVFVKGSESVLKSFNSVDALQVTSVGNFLILSDGGQTGFWLWNATAGDYAYMGERIPEPRISFGLKGAAVSCEGDSGGMLYDASHIVAPSMLACEDMEKAYRDLVIGLYSKARNKAAEGNYFSAPFFVRYAVELNDGSYTCLSGPILLFPCVRHQGYAVLKTDRDKLEVVVGCASLQYSGSFDYSAWSDIVRGVVVFATRGVEVNELTDDKIRPSVSHAVTYNDDSDVFHDSISLRGGDYSSYYEQGLGAHSDAYRLYIPFTPRSDGDILEELRCDSVFFKVAELGLRQDSSVTSSVIGSFGGSHSVAHAGSSYVRVPIKSKTIVNLTTQDQLTSVDYFGHCPLSSQYLMSYNSRLMLAGVRRGFFAGFDSFLPYALNLSESRAELKTYDIYVFIKTPSGDRVVKKTLDTYDKAGIYFYYPDPRAYRAVVYNKGNQTFVADMELTEHPGLNGACYFGHLPTGSDSGGTTWSSEAGTPSYSDCEASVNTAAELLANQIYQSEVNNPFVFTPRGNKTVGTGVITALASLTTALSQGQFGQHPVIVFTSEGIWAMEVDSEGYLRPAQPMSREVCLHPRSVLETDGAVYFVSKKGLMVVAGSQAGSRVTCVTERLNGAAFSAAGIGDGTSWSGFVSRYSDSESFLSFIRSPESFLAYDYIDGRVLIGNPSFDYMYAYGIKSGTVTKLVMPGIERSVRSYPDYLLQDSAGTVYSLYGKADECAVRNRVRGLVITRPMKLGGPVGVSSLRELVSVGVWNRAVSSVKTQVYLSNDLDKWYQMGSRFGAAARYFRIVLYVNLLPSERLSGTIIRYDDRRSDNMRV